MSARQAPMHVVSTGEAAAPREATSNSNTNTADSLLCTVETHEAAALPRFSASDGGSGQQCSHGSPAPAAVIEDLPVLV